MKNINKNLLQFIYKIFYIYNCNDIQYSIIKKYNYNLCDYNSNILINDYKNILLNTNIFLYELNNKLKLYHNDLFIYIRPYSIHLHP
jgi:hypothetical protein